MPTCYIRASVYVNAMIHIIHQCIIFYLQLFQLLRSNVKHQSMTCARMFSRPLLPNEFATTSTPNTNTVYTESINHKPIPCNMLKIVK